MAVRYFGSAGLKNLVWRVELRGHLHFLDVLTGERRMILGEVMEVGDGFGYGDKLFIEVVDKLVVLSLVATLRGHVVKLCVNVFSFI
jgi:hypothetical protein